MKKEERFLEMQEWVMKIQKGKITGGQCHERKSLGENETVQMFYPSD